MKEYKRTIFCVGVSHNSAELNLREELYLPEDVQVTALRALKTAPVTELMLLSTCNRLEIYGAFEGTPGSDDILNVFLQLQKFKPSFNAKSLERLKSHYYAYSGLEALEHMFAVASGLDSLVLGETQITGQFKEAAQSALENGLVGPALTRLTQDALSIAKKVRTHTEISKKPVSISHAAIDLASRVYGKISEHKVLIVGAGEMATLAAKYAMKYQPKSLFIANRTFEKANALATALQFGQAYPFERLGDILPMADIILVATAAEAPVIKRAQIEKTQQVRHHRPLFLIDIAMPRNIEPSCADLEDIYLFDIDDLKQVVAEHVEERRLAAEKARGMVAERALTSINWLDGMALKPALSQFRDYLDDLMQREMSRTLSKGAFQNLNEEQLTSIRLLMQSVAGKISSDASSRVRTPPEGFFQDQLAAALLALFPKNSRDAGET